MWFSKQAGIASSRDFWPLEVRPVPLVLASAHYQVFPWDAVKAGGIWEACRAAAGTRKAAWIWAFRVAHSGVCILLISVCLDNSEALEVAVWIFCCSLHFMWSSCTSWNLQCGNILTDDPCNIVTSSIIWTKSQFLPCDLNIKDGHSLLNFFSLRGRKWG